MEEIMVDDEKANARIGALGLEGKKEHCYTFQTECMITITHIITDPDRTLTVYQYIYIYIICIYILS